MNPLRKCISLAGAGWLRSSSDANDYRLYGNREYVRDQSGTKWIKLWLNWAEMQPAAVGSRAASWNDLSQRLEPQLARLDAQISAANADGIQVILGMYHQYPLWTVSPDTNGMPEKRTLADRFPSNVAPNGPWDWFVGYFMARYKYHAPINPLGPRDGYTLGNPVGAYLTAFEVCNEPNELNWPPSVAHSRVANMIITAENASWYWGSLAPADYRIWVFGPGSGDIADSPTETSARVDYLTFTGRVLAYLRDWWHPRAYCAWTHHNYNDIISNRVLPDTKAKKVRGCCLSTTGGAAGTATFGSPRAASRSPTITHPSTRPFRCGCSRPQRS